MSFLVERRTAVCYRSLDMTVSLESYRKPRGLYAYVIRLLPAIEICKYGDFKGLLDYKYQISLAWIFWHLEIKWGTYGHTT
jgi:hypothetical protein